MCLGPRIVEVLAALRGDEKDYVRLVWTKGACSDEHAAYKLAIPVASVAQAATTALAAAEHLL